MGDKVAAARQWWSTITILLVAAVFTEAAFAGAMLSGEGWARPAHAANAVVLLATAAIAGLVSIATLRHVHHGTKLGVSLLALAAVILVQTAVGRRSAGGGNLLWVHVPLGAALLGFSVLAAVRARRLGEE